MTTEQVYKLFLKHPIVLTDSRNVVKNSIFFSLKGENYDGNQFAKEAIERGAAFSVIDDKKYYISKKTVLVENSLELLQKLAKFHRQRLGVPVLAITGSNGKTTTKELIAAVMSTIFKITCTTGNLNNHIGVPLTLLQMNKDTEYGIIEMGANHAGEIAKLCSLADPDFGIITNIGKAHLEGFGSYEMIKKTKAELYEHIKGKKGLVFYNNDNTVLKELLENFENKISYGSQNAYLTGNPQLAPPYIHANIHFHERDAQVKTKLTGSYNFENIMAAACIGKYFGVDTFKIVDAIEKYRPHNYRSQLIEKNGIKITMDAYNANPTSMKASIESFVSIFTSPRYLILGDMLELGSQSVQEHVDVLENILKYPFNAVFLVGPMFTEASRNFPFKVFSNSLELSQFLTTHPLREGAVLLKGSRGIRLEKILDAL